jgi:hypothetical protein
VDGAEELFGLGQASPERFDAFVVLVEGDDIGDGFFMTGIVPDDELQFDAVGSIYSCSSIKELGEPAMGTNGPRPYELPRALVRKSTAWSAPDGPRPQRIPHG